MHVPRVRPLEHGLDLVLVEQRPPRKQPQHRAPERLGQPGGVVHGPRDKRPIRAEAPVGDEHLVGGQPVESCRYVAPPGDNKIVTD